MAYEGEGAASPRVGGAPPRQSVDVPDDGANDNALHATPGATVELYRDIAECKRMEAELIASAERLRRSEEHLRRAQRVGAIGSSEVELATGQRQWSDQYFRLLGYEPGSVPPGRESFLRAIVPEDRHLLDDFPALLATRGPIPAVELRARRKEGRTRWLERQIELMRGPDGQPTHIVFTLQDISERKAMELALTKSAEEARRSREHLTRAQRVGLIGSSELDLATGAQYWSEEFYRLLGLEPSAVKPCRDAFVARVLPEDRAKLSTIADIVGASRPIAPVDIRVGGGEGPERWLRRRVDVLRDGGRPTHLMYTVEDISERRRMELALTESAEEARRSREHLARAQRIGKLGSVEIDIATGATFWSDELYEMLGLSRDTAPGLEAYLTVVHPDDRDRVRDSGARICAGQPVEPSAYRTVRPDGELRWLYRTAEHQYDSDGNPCTAIATLVDITELRRSQEEQARLQEHLAHVQKLEALGALSGGMAHDFNNLLTSILGNAGVLRDDRSLSAAARRRAQAVARAAEQGGELTRRLLSFGRRQMLNPVALDLALVAQDLEMLLRPTLGEHIAFSIRAARGTWPVRADKHQLETAIINLAVNARDAMPNGGTLTIDLSNQTFDAEFVARHAGAAEGDYVAIAVSDTGLGMTPEVLARAFEPFFTTKPEGRGTGLGLAMVYGFAKQSGGYTRIDSEPGAGTCVTLYLPRGAKAKTSAAAKPKPKPTRDGTECILLVEDDALVREFVEVALGRLGYRVIVKSTGAAALAELARPELRFDLLLTDLMLPGGMNGGALAAEAARRQPGLRVLFASGYTEDALVQQGHLAPGQLLIPKPFDGDMLAAKVREALDALGPKLGPRRRRRPAG